MFLATSKIAIRSLKASQSNQMVINLNASRKNNVLESLEFSTCTELRVLKSNSHNKLIYVNAD